MVSEVRSAAGIEGFIILGAIYLVLNLLSRAGKKAAQRGTLPPTDAPGEEASTQAEGVSLENILREIQRVKQQKDAPRLPGSHPKRKPLPQQRAQARPQQKSAPPPMRPRSSGVQERGPLGRHSRTGLPSAEEVEENESLEGRSLEIEESLEVVDDRPARRQRHEVDSDEGAEAVVQRRIQEAEARNRPLNAADHRRFDARVRSAEPVVESTPGIARSRLQNALVWREILGPPKSMEP